MGSDHLSILVTALKPKTVIQEIPDLKVEVIESSGNDHLLEYDISKGSSRPQISQIPQIFDFSKEKSARFA